MFYPAHTTIENLLNGVGFKSFYVLAEYEERRTQSGKPYAKGLLAEAGGKIPFVMWENFDGVSKADVWQHGVSIFVLNGQVHKVDNVFFHREMAATIHRCNAIRDNADLLLPYHAFDQRTSFF